MYMSDLLDEASKGRAEAQNEAFTAEELRKLKRVSARVSALASAVLKTHTITKARSLLPSLVRGTARGGPPVAIGRQGHEEAVLLAYDEFAALRDLPRLVRRLEAPPSLTSVDMRQHLSEWIARRLLPDAPPHLVGP